MKLDIQTYFEYIACVCFDATLYVVGQFFARVSLRNILIKCKIADVKLIYEIEMKVLKKE